jgi:hypothetical protein
MKQKIAGLCLLLAVCLCLQVSAQAPTPSLYLQSSEMHDMMVQYNADLGNITRFYATNANTGFRWWWQGRRWRTGQQLQFSRTKGEDAETHQRL